MSAVPLPDGARGLVADWAGDRQAFHVSWGKAMMWVFLLSDTFIFGSFLTGYMTVRVSITAAWPNASEVFALHVGGTQVPLLLIAIMTFVLITSSGTMAMAVNCAYKGDRGNAAALMVATAAFGELFVLMQAFEWSKLLMEGMRPWENPWGAAQFGSVFFMITGFHGLHVTGGVILLLVFANRVLRGRADAGTVEIVGLYWHFVDLVWVFIFAFFYLW
jgi:cytochrome c oxidase subunit III